MQYRLGAAVLLLCSPLYAADSERWYKPEHVSNGAKLYQQNCQACHGPEGVGTPNWRDKRADGSLPPPPLNGTAHTWHHPASSLLQTMRNGGVPLGGVMPGFGERLDNNQMASILAYINSLWPEEVYQQWLQINRKSQ